MMDVDSFSWKVFADPVHEHISLHPVCTAIIDTPEFQRLRDIKQLGGAYFVFPGASHNRFEHSIGVCHLAGVLVKTLQARQPQLDISDQDVRCVEIAGLCHDLGHGPYSNVFDRMFIPRFHPEWKTEQTSVKMFESLVENSDDVKKALTKADLSDKDQQYIKNLICPPPLDQLNKDIVANKRNEIDVDKFDYILRDGLHLGICSNFNYKRFIQLVRVNGHGSEQQLCVRDKEAFNVYQLFQSRHALHKKAYKHRVTVAVELMLVEALVLAEEVHLVPGQREDLKVSECVKDMAAYLNLTDCIFRQIHVSRNEELQKSRDLLTALKKRKLFLCLAESCPVGNTECPILQGNSSNMEKERKIKEELMKKIREKYQIEYPEDPIAIQVVTLDFGKKDRNPVDEVRFYTKLKIDAAVPIDSSKVSRMFPNDMFQEQVVRVYLKHYWNHQGEFVYEHDQDYKERIGTIFNEWCKVMDIKCTLFHQDCQTPVQAT